MPGLRLLKTFLADTALWLCPPTQRCVLCPIIVASWVCPIYSAVFLASPSVGPPLGKRELDKDVPLFTKLIHPRVGFAEDPGTRQSFGRSRCELVAKGLWSASFDEPKRNPIERIREQFQSAGISLNQPWLNPGSLDWEKPADFPITTTLRPGWFDEPKTASVVANWMGSKICRDAIWSGDACNWLDWSAEEQNGKWIPIHRALGPNSMNTCSGISIYEARLESLCFFRGCMSNG